MLKLFAALVVVSALLVPVELRAAGNQGESAMNFTFEAIDGSAMPLSTFAGKVLLVVNTASFCGYTKQYEGLQALYERYQAKGLVVIGVPSNDFGAQEPKAEAEIEGFCKGAFGVTFPLTSKQVVKGTGAHPFYAWARATLGEAGAPRWNFHKYLVAADGKLVAGFSTQTEPLDMRLVKAVEAELKKIGR
jgi:glutathione peroxidase